MQIDWPRADDTTARQRDSGFLQSAQQRAHDANRPAHLPDKIVLARPFYLFGMNSNSISLDFNLRPKPRQYLPHESNVAEIRNAADRARFAGQQIGRASCRERV